MIPNNTEERAYDLEKIHDRIAAIEAAVQGADFCDHTRQNGISWLLDDVLSALDDFIKEMKGDEESADA